MNRFSESVLLRVDFKPLAALVLFFAVGFGVLTRAREASSSAADQLGWQMAIHQRTFQNFNFYDSMDRTAALGLKYMSFSANIRLEGTNSVSILNLSDKQIRDIKEHAEAKGIKFVNAYVALPADEAECRKSFEFARKMGLDILVGEPEPDALDTVEKLCKEYNVKVAIHDHPKPSRYWDPQNVLDAIKGRPLMGACADTGHWVRSGLDPVECLKKLEGHIFVLHFKDLNEKGVRSAHDVPWGTGAGQAKEMMEELKRQNFHGAFCVEYEYHYNSSTPEIAKCVKFFNQTCAELAAHPAAQ